jgi:hypothetical protein
MVDRIEQQAADRFSRTNRIITLNFYNFATSLLLYKHFCFVLYIEKRRLKPNKKMNNNTNKTDNNTDLFIIYRQQ